MCSPIWKRDPKSRALFVIANLFLSIGLVLRIFVRPSLSLQHRWLDGVCGMLLGISIVANLATLVRARRCRIAEASRP